LSPVPAADVGRGDGDLLCGFTDAFGRVVKDGVAGRSGDKLVLRGFQRTLLGHLLARREDGRLRHRVGLIGMARKNGKSGLASELGKGLLFLGPDGGELYSCAADKEQARITFRDARRSIEMEPELLAEVRLFRDAIEIPATGSVWRVLSAEAFTKEGLNPHAVLFDEVHAQPSRDLWDVMQLAMGNRVDPLMVAVTTAGVRTDARGADSLCYGLYQHGRRVASGELVDPSFFFAWWEPLLGAAADHRDPVVWAEANPGLGDLVALEDFESMVGRTPEAEFRTKRTNVFVASKSAALPHGAWDGCADPGRPDDPMARQVLMVDGSWTGDCTGIVSVTVEARPHVRRLAVWERDDTDPHWRVPIGDVVATIRELAAARNVAHVAFDPFRWQHTMAELESEGLSVVEFPTNSTARMVPAWKTFYDLVVDGGLTHDGDPVLARHVENMVVKTDQRGARPVKESSTSRRHIDLAICAVAGVAEALAEFGSGQVSHEPFVAFVS
jgi:phage terminase large subunit-like protein